MPVNLFEQDCVRNQQVDPCLPNPCVPTTTPRRFAGLLAALALLALPLLLDHGAVARAAALREFASGPSPYFVPRQALLLYVRVPLVAAAATVFLLTPGLLLALALRRSYNPWIWFSSAYALNLLCVGGTVSLFQSFLGRPMTTAVFLAIVSACSVAAAAVVVFRLSRGHALPWPFLGRPWQAAALLLLPPLLTLVFLSPKFYWEAFNGDGAQVLECARLLLFRPWPFWPAAAGEIASYPGFNSIAFAYPASWFLRLFGPLEVSARLPVLPALAALYAGVIALIEFRAGILRTLDRWLVWAGLSIFVLIMAFSASYDPYLADIASPFSQDAGHLAFLLGFLLALLQGDRVLLAVFLALTLLSSAGGALGIAIALFSAVVVLRPLPWKSVAWSLSCAAALSLILAAIASLLAWKGASIAHTEHNPFHLLLKFRFIQLTDWRRILCFLVLPTGVLPAVTLVAGWRRLDAAARMMACFTLCYFAVMYVQLFTSQHYYVPVMVLPLVVFWRSPVSRRPWVRTAALLGCAAGLIAAWPNHSLPVMASYEVGMHIENRVGGYHSMAPESFRSSELLATVLPYDWVESVPSKVYGGSPLAWNYYAHLPKPPGTAIYYLIQRETDPAPQAPHRLGNGFALFVLDPSGWERHRALKPPSPPGSRLFAIQPRNLMFYGADARGAPPVLDLQLIFDWFAGKLRPHPAASRASSAPLS